MISERPPSKKWRSLNILKKLTCSQIIFGKIKKFKTFKVALLKNMIECNSISPRMFHFTNHSFKNHPFSEKFSSKLMAIYSYWVAYYSYWVAFYSYWGAFYGYWDIKMCHSILGAILIFFCLSLAFFISNVVP